MGMPFTPPGVPGGWYEIPGYGWISLDFPSFGGDLDFVTRAMLSAAVRALAEQAAAMDALVDAGLLPVTQTVEYETSVVYSEIEYTAAAWYDKVIYFIEDLVAKFEKLLKAIHFKTILAVHQVAMLVSPQYRTMMQRIFKSLSEYSKAIGMGPAFIDLAIRSTRTLVLDVTGALGHSYDMSQLVWLTELDGFMATLAKNSKRYADNPFLIFTDLEEDIERRYGNVHGSVESSTLLVIEGLLKGAGKVAADIDKIDKDLLKLLNDLPSFVKSHIDPAVFSVLRVIDGFIAGEFMPQIQAINGVITQYGNDIRAAQAAASAAAARILTPKQTMMSLRDLPLIEQDEVLAGLDGLARRRSTEIQTRMSEWSRPMSDEFERLLQLPAPLKAQPVFLTFEHTLAPVPDLRVPVSGGGPFVGDY